VGALDQLADIAESVKQGVFGVYVEMDEGHELGEKDYSM
jgi:hypothetical protein